MQPKPSTRTPIALLAIALSAAGCRGERVRLDLAELADHQRHSLATDRIEPAAGRGLDRLDVGWVVRDAGSGAGAHLEIGRRWTSLELYSPASDPVARVELDVELAARGAARRARLSFQLNEHPLGQRRLTPGRHVYAVDLPAAVLRDGRNSLAIGLQPGRIRAFRGRRSPVTVHSISFVPAGGRPLRGAGPDVIRALPAAGGEPPTIELPTASRFDAVARLPRRAALRAGYSLRFRDGPGPAVLRVEALAEEGSRTLEERAFPRPESGEIDIDLGRWADEIVRVRIELGGPIDAVLRLDDARIEGFAVPEDGHRDDKPIAPDGLEEPPRSERLAGGGRPDVLVVLLDAARADALGAYGGEAPTPHVDGLAAAGTRFDGAVSPSAWTGQALPAVFTGLYPDSAGIEHWGSRLPPTVPTLAQLFSEAGYRTVLWTQHPFYKGHLALHGGFDEVHFGRKNDPSHLPAGEELFGATGVPDARPIYAFVHLMPPHTPYEPPPPFLGSLTGWYEGAIDPTAPFLNQFAARREARSLTAEELRFIRLRYLENAAYADHLVGQVLELYRESGRFEDALVAVLSDHGEAFLEHDRFLHGRFLYDEFVRVPLVVRWPRDAAGFRPVVDGPVSTIDLAPTLVDGLGLRPGIGFQGRSLLPAVFDGAAPDRAIYSYTRGIADGTRPAKPEYALRTPRWTLLEQRSLGLTRLYRAGDDPLEQNDLATAEPMRALLLRQAVEMQATVNQRILETLGEVEAEELDAETIERLKALGYLQ